MAEKERRFTVISNTDIDNEEKEREKKYQKARRASYQTNPLREQFMRYTNEEAGRRFTVEDLLKW